VACDRQSVLDQLQSNKSINPFAAHADLLSTCHSIVTQLLCRVKFIHVKGHQDNGLPTVLSREAWLNIEADIAAKNQISTTQLTSTTGTLPFESWGLKIKNIKIIKNHK